MSDKSRTESKAAQAQKVGENSRDGTPSDFVTGLLTFIVFLFFMTAWMYFSTE